MSGLLHWYRGNHMIVPMKRPGVIWVNSSLESRKTDDTTTTKQSTTKCCARLGNILYIMMTSSNGNNLRVTGHLCGEFTGPRWLPHTKASDAELRCFLICVWINGWVNNREAGGLRCHRAHYDVTIMYTDQPWTDPSWIYNFAIADSADWFDNSCNRENGACHRAAVVEATIIATVKPPIYNTPNPQTQMFSSSSCRCLCPIHWSQVLSRERRCSWSSADRRCSNYIWVINDFIAY